VRVVDVGGALSRAAIETMLSSVAIRDHDAEWVFAADADEFWWPRGHSLAEALATVPRDVGVVRAFGRHFVETRSTRGPFFERMIERVSPLGPLPPDSAWAPYAKTIRRVGGSNHVLRGWHPVEILHALIRPDTSPDPPARDVLERDTRLRDALRAVMSGEASFEFPKPSLVDDARFAVDVSVLGEADVLSAQRRMDELEARLASLERYRVARLERRLRALARRSLRRQ
jgi:hypothetical protein